MGRLAKSLPTIRSRSQGVNTIPGPPPPPVPETEEGDDSREERNRRHSIVAEEDEMREAVKEVATNKDSTSEFDRLEEDAYDHADQVIENVKSGAYMNETGTAGLGEKTEEGDGSKDYPLAPESMPNPLQKQALDDSEKTEDVQQTQQLGGPNAWMKVGGRKRKQSKKKKRKGKRKTKKKRN